MVICLGVPVALAGHWLIKATLDAGKGSACPACAVDAYFAYGPLGTLGGDDLLFQRTLCRSNRNQLHKQALQFAEAYKHADETWKVSPELSHGAMDGDEPQNIHDGKASITVAITHSLDAWGGNVIARHQETWRFEVVDENGWRACAVQQPDVCKDLIKCDGPQPSPSPSAPPAKAWDTRVPYGCLPDKPYHDLAKDCPSPPADWVQPGPYYCAPDQPFGIPSMRQEECAALG